MCRVKAEDGTITRCQSSLDKDKKRAYNRARYLFKNNTPIVLAAGAELKEPFMCIESLSVEQVAYLEQLENMPDIKALSAYSKAILAGGDYGAFVDVNYYEEDTLAEYPEASMKAYGVDENPALRMDTYYFSNQIARAFNTDITLSQQVASCQVSRINWEEDGIIVYGNVTVMEEEEEEEGKQVKKEIATWRRVLFYANEGDSAYGYYHSLNIDKDQSGAKLGTKLINHFDSVMLASGITQVRVTTEKIGGYAWARHGYDWDLSEEKFETSRQNIIQQLEIENQPHLNDESVQILDMIERLKAPHDHNYPTPSQVASLGQGLSEGKEATWVGKRVMLYRTWYGVRNLAPHKSD